MLVFGKVSNFGAVGDGSDKGNAEVHLCGQYFRLKLAPLDSAHIGRSPQKLHFFKNPQWSLFS